MLGKLYILTHKVFLLTAREYRIGFVAREQLGTTWHALQTGRDIWQATSGHRNLPRRHGFDHHSLVIASSVRP